MSSVLGIDAAWTTKNPSGLALVENAGHGWRLVAAVSSYARFAALPLRSSLLKPATGSAVNVVALLDTCVRLTGRSVDVVAVDMPLACTPITKRRVADQAVSVAYGSRHCATHSPSEIRPGRISDELTASFAWAGYPLIVDSIKSPALIEVYPHPALLELAKAETRLPYKYGKRRTYWPHLSQDQRRNQIATEWKRILCLLEERVSGVREYLQDQLPIEVPGHRWKAYEDVLDAIVCAWSGVCFLEGDALSYGDDDSAIWIPKPGV